MGNKRKTILKAAKKLFTKYGYKKVSMDEIAEEALVTKKTVYSYFTSKEQLLEAVIEDELCKMEKIVDSYNDPDDIFTTVNKTLYELLKYRKNAKLFISLAKEAKSINSIPYALMHKLDDSIIKYIKDRLDKAISDGSIKNCNTELTAFIIYRIYTAVLFEWNKDIDEKEVTESIAKILKDGLFN